MKYAVLDGIKPVIGNAEIFAEAELDLQVCIAVMARMSPRANANPMHHVVPLDMPYLISECAPYRERAQRQCDYQPRRYRPSRRNLTIHKRPPAGDHCQEGNDHSKRFAPTRLHAKVDAAHR